MAGQFNHRISYSIYNSTRTVPSTASRTGYLRRVGAIYDTVPSETKRRSAATTEKEDRRNFKQPCDAIRLIPFFFNLGWTGDHAYPRGTTISATSFSLDSGFYFYFFISTSPSFVFYFHFSFSCPFKSSRHLGTYFPYPPFLSTWIRVQTKLLDKRSIVGAGTDRFSIIFERELEGYKAFVLSYCCLSGKQLLLACLASIIAGTAS